MVSGKVQEHRDEDVVGGKSPPVPLRNNCFLPAAMSASVVFSTHALTVVMALWRTVFQGRPISLVCVSRQFEGPLSVPQAH